ncbi:hypothetical protein OG233_14165 [Streptomyces sp. NBC_01218]|uniref:hypothetical protein n=1 Tax=Streptomyces sp. NBC_01218 TaxID=2903780 RepID=UPI002E154549|nr:hypothetical protein OG233_14165 [Streptomyces sp. NBC_01218]
MTTFPLDRRTEILPVGGPWTDITPWVYERDPIKITRGAKSETGKVTPGTCSLTLNNRDGRFSPRNPRSPLFGKIGRNTPIRISVPGPESYLSLDGTTAGVATTPDVAALDIVGDLDVRVEVTADWPMPQVQTLIGKWSTAAAQRSWVFKIENGNVVLNWSPDSTVFHTWQWRLPALPRRAALRTTLDVNNGAGGHTAAMYWAPTLDGPWTPIGTPVVGNFVTSIYASTVPLQVGPVAITGWLPAQALIHRAEVRSGIGGTVVASPDFRALTEGTTAFSDSASRPWSVTGTARVSNRAYRFVGEVAAWPTRWDLSGTDVYVPIDEAGILRRLGQGRKPLASTLRRSIPRAASLLAYWPMEEGTAATAASSPVLGVTPLQLSRATWASATTLASSDPLPVLASAGGDLAQMTGTVPAPTGSPTGWRVQWVYRLDTPNTPLYTFMRIATTGTITEWFIQQSATGSRILGRDASGTDVISNLIGTGLDLYNQWNSVWFTVEQVGGTVQWDIYWQDVGGAPGHYGSSYSGTIGRVRTVGGPAGGYAAALDGMALGHLSVFSTSTTTAYDGALTAYDTEFASNRMVRLSQESGGLVPMTFTVGNPGVPQQTMGPQHPAQLLDLLEDAAATDGGILFERRDRPALHYRDRAALHNQTPALTLNYTAEGEAAGLEPVEDDQATRNDVTVVRDGGGSGRVEITSGPLSTLPPEQGGVGVYDTSVPLSLGSDDQTTQIAGWLARLGTVDEPRYPAVRVMLHAAPHLIPAALGLELGDLMRINNLPPWMPPEPALLMVRGLTETLTRHTWDVTFTTAPGRPWDVGVYDDPARGRYDTGGSQLAAAATATATTLSVAYTDGTRWITGAPNLVPDPSFAAGIGAWVCTRGATIGVTSWERSVVHSGTGAVRLTRVHPTDTGVLNMSNGLTYACAPGQIWTGSAWVLSSVAAANAFRVGLVWKTSGGTETIIYGTAPSVTSASGWVQVTVTATIPATAVNVRLIVEGRSAWAVNEWWVADDVRLARTDNVVGGDNPDHFPFDVVLGGERATVLGISGTTSPQTFTVTRSANGISKAQPLGTDVRLADPTYYAL